MSHKRVKKSCYDRVDNKVKKGIKKTIKKGGCRKGDYRCNLYDIVVCPVCSGYRARMVEKIEGNYD